MAKIRIIRVLEYTYDSAERAEADMARWTTSSGSWGDGMTMRSTHFLPELEVTE